MRRCSTTKWKPRDAFFATMSPLYSLYQPPLRDIASIYVTAANGAATYVEIIENDALYRICAAYLQAAGAPCFDDIREHDRYVDALRHRLRQAQAPALARDEALRAIRDSSP